MARVRRRLALGALGLLAGAVPLAACSDDAESSGDLSEFCSLLVSAADPFTADVSTLDAVTQDLRELRLAAPDEIRPAVETLEVAFETVVAQPDPDDAAALLAEQQDEVVAASEELAAYSLANCGIDLSR